MNLSVVIICTLKRAQAVCLDKLFFGHRPLSDIDRHRGGGHPPTPATPPCVRVRTRRFESVTLTILE